MAILEGVPSEFIAGDSWRWLKSLPDYPATTYTVTWYFENSSAVFSAVGTASGNNHSVTITAVTTAAYVPGRYRWYARAVDIATGLIKEIIAGESGWLTVTMDPAAAGKADVRTDAMKLLDAVTAALFNRADISQLSMSIAGRSISRMSAVELDDWRKRLQAQVNSEIAGSEAGLGRDIRVRFG